MKCSVENVNKYEMFCGNCKAPVRPTLKTLLLVEPKQLHGVELLSTAAAHIFLQRVYYEQSNK